MKRLSSILAATAVCAGLASAPLAGPHSSPRSR